MPIYERPDLRFRFDRLERRVIAQEAIVPLWESRMACALIERWGIVAAEPDNEDSAGRAKLRLQTPEELVNRACDTADLAVAEFYKRGWVEALPTVEEMKAKEGVEGDN